MGGKPVKLTADTNILVRAIAEDDDAQSRLAQDLLLTAELVVLTTTALCELVWVLSRGYRYPGDLIAEAVRRLADSDNVDVDRPAVDAGLTMMDAGGDFADGVIAHEGRRRGAQTFVSFDKTAVTLLRGRGVEARLVAP